MGTGFPGYTGHHPARARPWCRRCCATTATPPRMFGKWHNTPEPDISPAGPFDRWPTGLGFDYFYGFNQGETHQYYPTLYRNTDPGAAAEIAGAGLPLHRGHDRRGDRLDAQRPRRRSRTSRGSCYFSTGAVHAPHHVPKEWRDKFKGKFDHGWDKQREMTHAQATRDGHHPQGDEAHAAAEGDPGVGRPAGRREEGLRAADGELRRVHGPHRPPRRPADRQPRSIRRARQHADLLHRRRQRRERRRRAGRHVQRSSPACSASSSVWRAPSSGSTKSAGRRASRTCRSAGPGR